MDFFKYVGPAIQAASTNPLGIIAACIFAIGAAACYLFRNDSIRSKMSAFAAVVGFSVYAVVAALSYPEVKPKSTVAEKIAEAPLICSGRVRNSNLDPITSATITAGAPGIPPLDGQTDSKGFYQITLPNEARGLNVELIVTSQNYKKYVRNLPALKGSFYEDIILNPEKLPRRGSSPPPAATTLYNVFGRIVDDTNGMPVGQAAVTLAGVGDPAPVVHTDSEGHFSFRGNRTEKGNITIQVRSKGFKEYSRLINGTESQSQEIRLIREP